MNANLVRKQKKQCTDRNNSRITVSCKYKKETQINGKGVSEKIQP